MINPELINSYVNQLDTVQAKKIVLEFIRHCELNENYYFDKIIDNIIKIVNKSSNVIDRIDYIDILKNNPALFANQDNKVIADSIKIIGYDNIMNTIKLEYTLEGDTYPYSTNVDIDRVEEQKKLNILK